MSVRTVATILALLVPAGSVVLPTVLTLTILAAPKEAVADKKRKRKDNLDTARANRVANTAASRPGNDQQQTIALRDEWKSKVTQILWAEQDLKEEGVQLALKEEAYARALKAYTIVDKYIVKQREKMLAAKTESERKHYRDKIEKEQTEKNAPAKMELDRTRNEVLKVVGAINTFKREIDQLHKEIGDIRFNLGDMDDVFTVVEEEPLNHPLSQVSIATHSQYGRIGVIYETLPSRDLIYVQLPPESASSSTSSSATAASSSTSSTAQPSGATNSTSWNTPTGQPPAGLIFPGSK